MPLAAAVFDLDGTLIDSHLDIAGALNEVLESLGAPPHPPEEVKRMIGGGVARLLGRALVERPELFEPARERFFDVYRRRLLDTTRLYDGVAEMLRALARANITTAIATNKPASFTGPIVERLQIEVRAWAGADEVPAKKPDPAVVRLALERAHVAEAPPDRVAYVGDMPIDHETANAFLCPFVGVTWGFDPEGLAATRPPVMARSAGELAELLLGW